MNTRRLDRGFSLIEVFAALTILAVASLGLLGGMVIAVNSNGVAAKRTLMVQFAQARIERLLAETRTKIPTAATTSPDCSAMAVGTFVPSAAPGTGGWMLDVIDGDAPAAAGDDSMFGPVLIADANVNSKDDYIGQTVAKRAAVLAAWNGGGLPGGCGDASLNVSGILCREIHIEPSNVGGIPMLRAWVRVVQGGGDWRTASVTMQEDIAQ